ncbi:MAG TPA: SUMF1/EgtB/PvdO family nonheme iron enzyme [Polyangiaceae bacterium]|nr:SUMF1/EgtB/PvdO family nonheme iron enzyme [Polyangiaceae bacterium]
MRRGLQILGLGATLAATACQSADAAPREPAGRSETHRAKGRRVQHAVAAPCPKEMAAIGAVCVDRWEAHLVIVEGERTATHPHTKRPPGRQAGREIVARSAPGVFPQAYVSRVEASAACAAAGKRLCTLREWYRACRGSSKGVYPWGTQGESGRCNSGKAHLLSRLFGRDSKRWTLVSHFNSPLLNAEPGFLAKTGAHAGCAADNGTHDMVGNLHEWVSDIVDDQMPSKLPVLEDIVGKIRINRGNAIFMGGFYSTVAEHGEGCTYLTPGHQATYHDYSTGFRCCKAVVAGAP